MFATEQDLPPLVEETFTADSVPEPWDCSAEITISKDEIDQAVITACNEQINADFPDEDCNADNFQKGDDDSTFDASKLPTN